MYNETIYNVFLSPEIEARLFRKRNSFTIWFQLAIMYLLILTFIVVMYLFDKLDNLDYLSGLAYLGIIIMSTSMVYILIYNPLRKYHKALQIYFYLVFLYMFYYNNEKYPNGLGSRLKYLMIVQVCIDSISRYIKVLENNLISGENTISRIKYLRCLRDILYKSKRREFFSNHIDEFKVQLNVYFTNIHRGLKAVLDFNESIEYLDQDDYKKMYDSCHELLKRSKDAAETNRFRNVKINRVWIIIIIIIMVIFVPILSYILGANDLMSMLVNIAVLISSILGIIGFVLPKNIG